MFTRDPFKKSAEDFSEYLDQNHTRTVPYVNDFKISMKIDHVYRLVYDLSSSKWMLGKKILILTQ